VGGVNLTLLEACDLEEEEALGGWTGEKERGHSFHVVYRRDFH